MIVIPLDRSKTVFRSGMPHTFRGVIPRGGHCMPISIEGERAASKKAQKNATKNITSLKIKSMKPVLIHNCSFDV